MLGNVCLSHRWKEIIYGTGKNMNTASCFFHALREEGNTNHSPHWLFKTFLSSVCKYEKWGRGKGLLATISSQRRLQESSLLQFSQRAAGPLSLHRSAIISGLECYKIMPSLLLPSINNNCIWIQQSHVEKLANDTYMRASTHLETQIILIILHEISFSFPNLAPVRALSMACRGPLLFFPALLFPWKLLTRALAGYCAEPYGVLLRAHRLLAEAEENQFLRQLR